MHRFANVPVGRAMGCRSPVRRDAGRPRRGLRWGRPARRRRGQHLGGGLRARGCRRSPARAARPLSLGGPRRARAGVGGGARRRALRPHRCAAAADHHGVPARRDHPPAAAARRDDRAADARPVDVPAGRRARRRAHDRRDDGDAERPDGRLGRRAARAGRDRHARAPGRRRAGSAGRDVAARARRAHRGGRGRAHPPRRRPRHRLGRGGHTRRGARRLHLVRHLVARRRRARRAGARPRCDAGGLHQRARHRGAGPVPAQPHGPVAAGGGVARVGAAPSPTHWRPPSARVP